MASDGPTHDDSFQREKNRQGRRSGRNSSLEQRIWVYCLIFSIPVLALCVVLVWHSSLSVQAAVLIVASLALLLLSSLLIEEVVRPLQTLANVVAALREEDYSFRARGSGRGDGLGELSAEINALADLLQSQRLGELEAGALLRRIIGSMDAPVLAFDQDRRLRLLNAAAERALALDTDRDLGWRAEALRLGHLLDQPDEGVTTLDAVGGEAGTGGKTLGGKTSGRSPGRWMVRRSGFRQRGVPHTLLLLSDVSTALREEERLAWQRLIRVLGHEISNSLAPIKSIAGSLLARLPAGDGNDFARGLTIIEGRAESLNRFVQAYRQLAQLPAPVMKGIRIELLLERVVALETRLDVVLGDVDDVEVRADPDQMEQLLINLVKNAVEAVIIARDEGGVGSRNGKAAVTLSARKLDDAVSILVEDSGLGLTNTANLFVPFYTTKRDGSGVGLALVRQIAEAHGGTVSLRNREGSPGCVAEVRIPLM